MFQGFPLAPNAWDPWGSPPPLSPFEASPYNPHPSAMSLSPKPYFHPAFAHVYQMAQMMSTPGFNPFSARQLSTAYDPVMSPTVQVGLSWTILLRVPHKICPQALYHPAVNPSGLLAPSADPRPWFNMMKHNPAAFANHMMPAFVSVRQAIENAPTMGWFSPPPNI